MLAVVIEEFLPEKYSKLVSFIAQYWNYFFRFLLVLTEFVKPLISFIFDKCVVTGEFRSPTYLQDTYNNIYKTFVSFNQKALILDTNKRFPLFPKHLHHLQNDFCYFTILFIIITYTVDISSFMRLSWLLVVWYHKWASFIVVLESVSFISFNYYIMLAH